MINKLNSIMAKRKEKMYNFYYRSFGDRIKKERLKHQLTQETLSKGICSNTYISKIENNKAILNNEQLYMIMERVGIATDEILMPENMIDKLEESIEYFYDKDTVLYKELIDSLANDEYGILLDVIRLGYYVLIEEYAKASVYYEETFRYFNSLEDFGFTTFLIYGCYYNVGIHNYKRAYQILKSIENSLQIDDLIHGLYYQLNFIVLGNLNFTESANDYLLLSNEIFDKNLNLRRKIENAMYVHIFKVYEGLGSRIVFRRSILNTLTNKQRNFYLLIMSQIEENPTYYLDLMIPNGEYYLAGLFFKAKYLLDKDKDKYKEIVKKINEKHYQMNSNIDYTNFLQRIDKGDKTLIKAFLIEKILPYTIKKQNFYFMKKTTTSIVEILREKFRYKDGDSYIVKYETEVKKLQNRTIFAI